MIMTIEDRFELRDYLEHLFRTEITEGRAPGIIREIDIEITDLLNGEKHV